MKKLIAVVTVLAVSTAQADTIYVDADCPGGDGSELDPYCSIQTAIDNAVDTDEIVVAPGTYFETIDFLGKAITLRSSNGPEATIIDAQFTASVVTCDSGEGPDSVLQAFTITRGYDFDGGGMMNDGTSPTVIGCIFFFNIADAFDGRGGGMYNFGGSPTVIDCTFDGNYAFGLNRGSGGGMHNKDSSPTVIGCTFIRNLAPLSLGAGGGMYNKNSNPIIINCLFDANVGTDGGGMRNSNSSPVIINCSFVANSSGFFNTTSNLTIKNCIVWGNGSLQIFDNPLSVTTVSYSDIQGGWSGAGSNNIDADPLFVSISNCCSRYSGCDDPGCEAAVCEVDPFCCDVVWDLGCVALAFDMCSVCPNDLRLLSGSPCIDAGDNTAVPEDITTDLDGNPRFLDVPETPDTGNPPDGGPIVDMGAFESLGGGCLAVTSQEIVCHADGTTFTVNIEGLNVCTGGTTQVTFTASGGAVGQELCFTALVNDGGFCCTTEICVTIPDCTPAALPSDLDGDGIVGMVDFLALLAAWGTCSDCCTPDACPADFDGDCSVGILDLLILLGNWTA